MGPASIALEDRAVFKLIYQSPYVESDDEGIVAAHTCAIKPVLHHTNCIVLLSGQEP